jgi:ribosomal protein L12E/L44/L45/RPP1/RPP2
MNASSKPQSFVIALLLLAVLGLGVFAWREHDALTVLRSSQVSEKDLAAARARAFEAEKRNKDLEAQLAAAKSAPPAAPANARGRGANAADGATGLAALFQGRGGADMQALITGMMNSFNTPQNVALQATAAKANLSVQYAPFFRNSGLSGEQADAVTTLLANRQSVMQDVMAAAMASGVQPDAQTLQTLVRDQQAQIDAQLKTTMGDAVFSQYETYQATLPRRQEVASYQQQLTMAGVPMDAAQSEALISALGPSATPDRGQTMIIPAAGLGGGANVMTFNAGAGGGGVNIRVGGGTSNISANNLTAAATVLTPTQMQVLQATQQSQQAASSIGQVIQMTIGAQQRGGAPNATGNRGAARGN